MVARIIGTGSCLPNRLITNDDLSNIVDTSDEWIKPRTGISTRHIAIEETTVTMAVTSALRAIEQSGIDPLDIDLILSATFSPDNLMPNTACEVQRDIGALNASCFDINAACTGFLYAYNTAQAYIASGMAKTVLVIGAETTSKFIDWTDRSTCVLFGDGAGAVIVVADESGFIGSVTGSDGVRGSALQCEGRRMNNHFIEPDTSIGYIKMDGQEVFKFAVKTVPNCICKLLSETNTNIEDISLFLLHQANLRILSSVAKKLSVDISRFPINLSNYGNTSAATLPILIDEVNRAGKLNRGDKIILSGFGAGLTWGASLITW